MTTLTATQPRETTPVALPKRPRPSLNRIAVYVCLMALLAVGVWSIFALDFNVKDLSLGLRNASNFIARMFPLDFPPVGEVVALTLETLAIVGAATVLAVVLSLPVALLAATNTSPNRGASVAARVLVVLMRAIPDLVFAIFFLRVFGLGALPGVLALGLHSIGMVGKLYADAIEDLDRGPVEALKASGAGRFQQVISGVIPPLMPQLVATALHRFDINLRTSVLLGYVGVGGLGYALAEALNTMNYRRGMALALIIVILCLVVELISGSIRMVLLGRATQRRGLYGVFERLSAGWVVKPTETHLAQRTAKGKIRVAPQWDADRISRFLTVAVTLVLVVASFVGVDATPAKLWTGIVELPQTIGLFFPPSARGIADTIFEAMLVTIQIGFAATLIGIVLAVPIGSLAARNVTPNRVAVVFRTVIVLLRAIPELILAIILIVMMGLGAMPGAIALGIGSVGLLGKLVADSIEETDVRVQEAVRAGGAGPFQVYTATTFRQVMPALVAHILYQLDVNIRSATLLGIVGAGGVGYYLLQANRVVQFDVVSYIVLIILATVLVLEGLAMWIRSSIR